ncbi:putative F-box domain-containing protein [Helianthus annuus]|uniref:F-box domain-containing protein n=1 Tax=Helianthus annuus TaxID=4232 RepID=A0A251S774_HELAN|nr:putative F-box domain-containing protein [Helianthus annuus]KAJ0462240.1 putative F-box domain-containing protein [Helianthus annuus]KAJ0837922.1 putative F-box domain-containing protein [Helianthus annuus]
MSDNIPIELQEEIMKRLPVKSLIQFRSVSKSWKSLIDSSHFIADYNGGQPQLQLQEQHLFVRYQNKVGINDERKYDSIVDDDSFPHRRVSFTLPRCVKMLIDSENVGSSHGLMCLYSRYFEVFGVRRDVAVVWNVLIGKAVAVAVPNVGDASSHMYATALGFGVCPETFDPKIVKINYVNPYRWDGDIESITSIPHQVEVFTLSTGTWRSPYGGSSNLPRKSIQFSDFYSIVIDGVLYSVATDRIKTDAGTESSNLIVSFDLTSEEFKEIYLPPRLEDYQGEYSLSVSKLCESLVVLERNEVGDATIVWRMDDDHDDDDDDDDDDGVPVRSFTKLFTINTPHASIIAVHAFRKSGESIVVILDDDCESFDDDISLVLYEPFTKRITNLGIKGTEHVPTFMRYYMETLLLLDQPNDMIYDKGEKRRLESYMQRT